VPERTPRWLRIAVGVLVAAGVGWLLLTDTGDGAPADSATDTSVVDATPAAAAPAGDVDQGPVIGVSGLPAGYVDELPAETLEVLDAIEAGGPHPYRQDGSTFFNREGLLPLEADGYYREYTVETPGSPDRGARRLVVGGRGEVFYTDDHYGSFVEVVDARV
jgi:guanyl-specific ribonuclease Sa